MNTPETVVVTEKEYGKGRLIFEAEKGWIDWVVSPPGEAELSAAVARARARVAVLGVEKYSGPLYEALAANTGGKPALIARHGIGYDGVSLEQCRRHKVMLAITLGAPDRSVAEHALALMLGLTRNIAQGDAGMRAGRWSPRTGYDLGGRTLGLAGFGAIARQVALIASAGFGMKVIAYDLIPLADQCARAGQAEAAFMAARGLSAYYTDFAAFAPLSDIVSIHMPAMVSTDRWFNAERLALLKPGALLVNTSRGWLVDEDALYDALVSGRLGAAGLDVFRREPYIPESAGKDLRTLANVVLTPHTASDTLESNSNMQRIVIGNIRHFRAGEYDKMKTVALG